MVKHMQKIIYKKGSEEDEESLFFEVIHDYRKIEIARYKRKLRNDKKKLIQKKLNQEKLNALEERNQILNQNMLAQENIWNCLLDDSEKVEQSGDTQPFNEKPDRLTLAKQFVNRLDVPCKRTLFVENFINIECPRM